MSASGCAIVNGVNARFDPSGPLRGRLRVPADKSISHRAAILAAMASEPVTIKNYLQATDTRSTLNAVRELGIHRIRHREGRPLLFHDRHAAPPSSSEEID